MAWEKEIDEVDKALGEHRICLVNRAVLTLDGEPQRHWIHLKLGGSPRGEYCGHCGQPVERGMTLDADGKLASGEGEINPRDPELLRMSASVDTWRRPQGALETNNAPWAV